MTSQDISVTIASRKKLYFAGNADTITSLNDKGEFDILPEHTNFISLIRNYVVLNKGTDKEQKFVLGKGVLRVKENIADIFLDV